MYHPLVCFSTALSADERLLFRDRINFLSRKLAPGFSKLFWTGKGAAESFIKESRLGAAKVRHSGCLRWAAGYSGDCQSVLCTSTIFTC